MKVGDRELRVGGCISTRGFCRGVGPPQITFIAHRAFRAFGFFFVCFVCFVVDNLVGLNGRTLPELNVRWHTPKAARAAKTTYHETRETHEKKA